MSDERKAALRRAAALACASAAAALALAPPAAAVRHRPRTRPRHARAVPQPAALRALEAKALQFPLTSVVETIGETVRVPAGGRSPLHGPLGPFNGRAAAATHSLALFQLRTEISYAERKASLTGSVIGIPISARDVGGILYTKTPFVSFLRKGRTWLAAPDSSGPFARGPHGAPRSPGVLAFGGAIRPFARARSFAVLAPSTIAGQAASGFAASIPSSSAGGFGESSEAGEPLSELLGGRLRPLGRYEAFFAEDGVPLLARATVGFRGQRFDHDLLIAQEDVESVNEPIAPVEAPPAKEVITQAELERAERTPPRRRTVRGARRRRPTG